MHFLKVHVKKKNKKQVLKIILILKKGLAIE